MCFYRRFQKIQKAGVLWGASSALMLQLGACNISDFTTTTTTTIDGREVIQFIVRSTILTPLNDFVDNRIDAFFDAIEDDEE